MYRKSILIAATSVALFLNTAAQAYANPVPEFGNCLNPQWSKTQENQGSNHGVVGVGTFSGTDTIYSSNGNVTQCLCTDANKGYQTDWLKASGMAESQIDNLKAQGWIYVQYGEEWGLEKSPYLAKNTEYACTAYTTTPTSTETQPTPENSTPIVTPTQGSTETPKSENITTTNVLGLASTGNAIVIYLSLLAGVAALVLGLTLKKLNK